MSDDEEKEAVEPYVPPKAAWRLPVLLEASKKDLEASRVDCSTCPVFILCESGEYGTGWVCQTCNATGIRMTEPEESGGPAPDLLGVDCGKHNFIVGPNSGLQKTCSLCTGDQIGLEMGNPLNRFYLLATVHAKVPIGTRQKVLKARVKVWEKRLKKGTP